MLREVGTVLKLRLVRPTAFCARTLSKTRHNAVTHLSLEMSVIAPPLHVPPYGLFLSAP